MKNIMRIFFCVPLLFFWASNLTHTQTVCSASASIAYNHGTGNLEGDISVTNRSQNPISICVRSIMKRNSTGSDCDTLLEDYTNYLSLGVVLTYNDTRYVATSYPGRVSFTVEVLERAGNECESDTIYCEDEVQCHFY